jgi:hypothetical protein
MDEQQRRRRAISLYLQGKQPGAIGKALGRSGVGFTNGSKLMIRATRSGSKVDHEHRNDCRHELALGSCNWFAPFASSWSKLSTRRKEPWRSNGSFNACESARCQRSGRSIVSSSGKVSWLNRLTIAAPALIQHCNLANPMSSSTGLGGSALSQKQRTFLRSASH